MGYVQVLLTDELDFEVRVYQAKNNITRKADAILAILREKFQ